MKNQIIFSLVLTIFGLLCHAQTSAELANGIEKNMIVIPGGSFIIGSIDGYTDELPIHEVAIDPFLICKYEVTVAEFSAFVNETGYVTDAEKEDSSSIFLPDYRMKKGLNWRYNAAGKLMKETEWNLPVTFVSWNDANAFCRWLSNKTGKDYRLPTEAEWEFAARSGDKNRRFSWGNFSPVGERGGNIADITWKGKYKEGFLWERYNDGYLYPAPAGRFLPNYFGLYDMTGNVYEFCKDAYDTLFFQKCSEDSITINPCNMGNDTAIVVKGGGFLSGLGQLRISSRISLNPDVSASVCGFRVARDKNPEDRLTISEFEDPLSIQSGKVINSPEMILIKGGQFNMGSKDGEGEDDEHPLHAVYIDDFYMAKHEVTVAQFKYFIDETYYKTEVEKRGYSYHVVNGEWAEWKGITWKHDEEGNKRPVSDYDHPVIHITWNDAKAYCDWLSSRTGQEYHLPTEAEWEYAARCGSKEYKYPWGDSAPSSKKVDNLCDESFAKVYVVKMDQYWQGYHDGCVLGSACGAFAPNDFGLYDMGGNVCEWCSDWYNQSNYKTDLENAEKRTEVVINPYGPLSGDYRVLRGGSFLDLPNYSRAAFRNGDIPVDSFKDIGFRVSRTLK